MNDRTRDLRNVSPLSRRAALRSGGLAALVAGLIGSAATPAHASGRDVVVVNGDDLAATSIHVLAHHADEQAATETARERLWASLTAEQRRQLLVIEELKLNETNAWIEVIVSELGRHFPGIAPAVPLVWEHLLEQPVSDIGVCCGAGRSLPEPS